MDAVKVNRLVVIYMYNVVLQYCIFYVFYNVMYTCVLCKLHGSKL